MRRAARAGGLLLLALSQAPSLGAAQATPEWSARKCDLYADIWDHVSDGDDLAGIGPDFLAAHDAFIASGCQTGAVCPETGPERALADRLSLMAISEGVTGSFLPFACPR